MSKFRSLYEYQSGGYPMEQVLVVEDDDNGQTVPKVCAFFADAEMDVFMVEYGYDGEITLDAEACDPHYHWPVSTPNDRFAG